MRRVRKCTISGNFYEKDCNAFERLEACASGMGADVGTAEIGGLL